MNSTCCFSPNGICWQASPQSTSASTPRPTGMVDSRGPPHHASSLQRARPHFTVDRGRGILIRPRPAYAPLPVVNTPPSTLPSPTPGAPRLSVSEPVSHRSPTSSSPPIASDDRTVVTAPSRPRPIPCQAQQEAANAARRQSRHQDNIGYGEMRAAHAAGKQARFPIATTPAGDIIGQRTKWHRAVRSIAKRTLDWSIREHKKHPISWKWSLDTIQRELDEMFSFEVPVREDVLTEYVAGFISNDRSKWKKFWVENGHRKHEDCPDEAFAMLDKYWRSDAGKRESEMMKEKRSRVGATSSGSIPYSDDSPSQKRIRHDDEPEDYLDFAEDDSTDPLFRCLRSPV